MLVGLDHLVILVEGLEEAVAGYEELGFRVTPGGEHADGLTRNALVPFADGTYLELVAFVDPTDERDNVWGWRSFLESGGLVDYCVASDDLAADARRLGQSGFGIEGPTEGGRRLPDGAEIRWKSARFRQEGRVLPFLIEDLTLRSLRVPAGPAARHPNGAIGISRLSIAVWDASEARRPFVALTGGRAMEESGDTFYVGRHELVFLTPELPPGPVERRLQTLGPGPFAVELEAGGQGTELDLELAQGARITLGALLP